MSPFETCCARLVDQNAACGSSLPLFEVAMEPDSVRRFGFGVDSAAAGVDCPPHCSLDRHARDPLVEKLATRVERFFAVST